MSPPEAVQREFPTTDEERTAQSFSGEGTCITENPHTDPSHSQPASPIIEVEAPSVAEEVEEIDLSRDRAPRTTLSNNPRRGAYVEEVGGYDSDSTISSTDSARLGRPLYRRKYIDQYAAYIRQLESRINTLEANSKREVSPSPTEIIIDKVPPPRGYKVAIPELNLQTWEEYIVHKGKVVPETFYAIDVLIDEPILYHQKTKRAGKQDDPSLEVQDSSHTTARRAEGLPPRIRINTEIILDFLNKVSKKRFPMGTAKFPRSLLRPYKLLYLYESDLREALEETKAKVVKNKAEKEEKTKKKADELAEYEIQKAAWDAQQAELGIERPGGSRTPIGSPRPPDAERIQSTGLVTPPNGSQTPAPTTDSPDAANETGLNGPRDPNEPKLKEPKKPLDLPEPPVTFDQRLESQEAVDDLGCLIKFIDDYLKPKQNEFDKQGYEKVRYSELWHLLRPGQFIYVEDKNCSQKIWKLVQTTGGRPYLGPHVPPPPIINNRDRSRSPGPPGPPPPPPIKPSTLGYDEVSPFMVDCCYLDYNGVRFGPIFQKFHIEPYELEKEISKLNIMPLSYAFKYGLLNEADLMDRGRRFLEITEVSHRYYSGQTVFRHPSGMQMFQYADTYNNRGPPVSAETVESEVIIDFERTFDENPDWQPRVGDDLFFELMDVRETREPVYDNGSEDIDNDYEWDRQVRSDLMVEINVQTQKFITGSEKPHDRDLLLLPRRVFGFLLRNRKWAGLDIQSLKAIKQRQHGFDDLELPEGHKNVVQALVQTHFRRYEKKKAGEEEDDEQEFDLVRDKGKGLIILLHGAPGVGKTSTAECVAESNNKPLLPITCGDLGITASDVERKLETNFRLAQAWGCVLLLDEADVFLAQRTSSDLERNAVVSVFLRVLEYYEGILFLTTNRVGAFDEAFKSRIHMSLFYPWLNSIQTHKIWAMQIRRARERLRNIAIDESGILHYADFQYQQQCKLTQGTGWNGRQIRNAFQSATALAMFESKNNENDEVVLKVSHFEIVAKAAAEFDDYLIRTTGFSDSERAANNLVRADSFSSNARNLMSFETMNQLARSYGGGQYGGAGIGNMNMGQGFSAGGVGNMGNQNFGMPNMANQNFGYQNQPMGNYGMAAGIGNQNFVMGGVGLGMGMQNQGSQQGYVAGMGNVGMGQAPQQQHGAYGIPNQGLQNQGMQNPNLQGQNLQGQNLQGQVLQGQNPMQAGLHSGIQTGMAPGTAAMPQQQLPTQQVQNQTATHQQSGSQDLNSQAQGQGSTGNQAAIPAQVQGQPPMMVTPGGLQQGFGNPGGSGVSGFGYGGGVMGQQQQGFA